MKAEVIAAKEQYAMVAGSEERYWHLSELLAGWVSVEVAPEQQISSLSLDSRRVKPGALFLACCGRRQSGHGYISVAVDRGAVAVVYDPLITIPAELQMRLRGQRIPLMPLPDAGVLAGRIAARFYAQPSCQVRVAGVTGTNGKTSVSHFLAQALHQKKAPCGLMGTLGVGLAGAVKPSELTTPDAVTVQEQLAEMRDAGAPWAVMEVSSHALDQGRVSGVIFDTAIFTNLSRDHLDYHGDMASYKAAKAQLFREGGLRHAVINVDDPVGCALLTNLPAGVAAISYGLTNRRADLQVSKLRCNRSGMAMSIRSARGEGELHCSLLGQFNAYNLLAALGGLLVAGIPFAEALQRLSQTRPVVGRMESFGGQEKEPLVVVDYAHTPAALEQALRSLRGHLDRNGQLWCVFGCGGARDRGKRPLMGAIAESLADFVVLTDDNPRDEGPIRIIIDILSGIDDPDSVYKFRNRTEAITRAVQLASPKDIVLIAGKGHEDYQQVGSERRPYSDREQVQRALQQRLAVCC